jgi:hypothetical protein
MEKFVVVSGRGDEAFDCRGNEGSALLIGPFFSPRVNFPHLAVYECHAVGVYVGCATEGKRADGIVGGREVGCKDTALAVCFDNVVVSLHIVLEKGVKGFYDVCELGEQCRLLKGKVGKGCRVTACWLVCVVFAEAFIYVGDGVASNAEPGKAVECIVGPVGWGAKSLL